jgi:hypothetical protein
MKIILLLFCQIFTIVMVSAQDNFLEKLMQTKPQLFDDILKNKEKYEVQIMYTQINRNAKNKPSFKTFTYNLDANHYFYPASTVKLPACLLALEKLNKLGIKGLNSKSAMITKANFEKQTEVKVDSSSKNNLPSIENYIKKILLVSDNDAFNRLYEFIGQKDFNLNLKKKGFLNTSIVHRLEAGMNLEQNKHTNPIDFFEGDKLVYKQEGQINNLDFYSKVAIKKGIGYYGANDELINEPLDFTFKNKFALADQHHLLKTLLFPETISKSKRFVLTQADYQLIYKYMSQLPHESDFPVYPIADYWPTYCKFALFGSEKEAAWPKNIRVFNKVGDAYGFLLDNAYIVDFEHNIEFLVSVVIHCNADQIYNDNKYEYDQIGLPFMKNLGQLLYNFELSRPRKNIPDLRKFKFDYSKN